MNELFLGIYPSLTQTERQSILDVALGSRPKYLGMRGRNDRSEKAGNRGQIFSILRCITDQQFVRWWVKRVSAPTAFYAVLPYP